MNSLSYEDELSYELSDRHLPAIKGERVRAVDSRNLTGRQKCQTQARYARQTAPVRMSSAHRRARQPFAV